jgi:hypothetical protein
MHASTRLIIDRHIRSKIPSKLPIDRHPQCDGEVLLCCQQELHMQVLLGVPTGKNPEDSNLVSVDAIQSFSTYPSVMIGANENILHSMAKMCRSTIMHIPHSCSNCQWYIIEWLWQIMLR